MKNETPGITLAEMDLRPFLQNELGILTGGGGGFTQVYTDFAIEPSGTTHVVNYVLDIGTHRPVDLKTAPLLLNDRAQHFEKLIEMALESGFFDLKLAPPLSSIVRHTAVAHPEKGLHHVVWALGAEPVPPKELVEFDGAIRAFLTTGFEEEFGG